MPKVTDRHKSEGREDPEETQVVMDEATAESAGETSPEATEREERRPKKKKKANEVIAETNKSEVPQPPKVFTKEVKVFSGSNGIIAAVSGKDIKVVTDEGLQTFRCHKDCKVTIDGKKGYVSDLDNGWEISLGGSKTDEIKTLNAKSKKG